MKVLLAYHSKTGSTEKVALEIKKRLEEKGHKVKLAAVSPLKNMKAYQYRKDGKNLKLKDPVLDVKSFDLIVVGTPVWGFCPTPIILSYLRNLNNTSGKKFALFATCTALPGTTIQRMGSILTTKQAKVLNSLTIRSVFPIDEAKLVEVKEFVQVMQKLV